MNKATKFKSFGAALYPELLSAAFANTDFLDFHRGADVLPASVAGNITRACRCMFFQMLTRSLDRVQSKHAIPATSLSFDDFNSAVDYSYSQIMHVVSRNMKHPVHIRLTADDVQQVCEYAYALHGNAFEIEVLDATEMAKKYLSDKDRQSWLQ